MLLCMKEMYHLTKKACLKAFVIRIFYWNFISQFYSMKNIGYKILEVYYFGAIQSVNCIHT